MARLIADGQRAEEDGDFERARALYADATALDAGHADAQVNLGNALRELGRVAEALAAFDRAIAIESNSAAAHYNRGLALVESGNADSAESALRSALEARPGFPEALVLLAEIFEARGQPDRALEQLDAAIRMRPDYAGAVYNKSLILKSQGKFDQSETALREAIASNPENMDLTHALGDLLGGKGSLNEAVDLYRRVLNRSPGQQGLRSNLLLCLNHLESVDRETIFREHQEYGRIARLIRGSRSRQLPNAPEPERRLRLGYVSGDFRRHPVAHFLEPLIEHLDRSRFEVFCYHSGSHNDDMTERIRRCSDAWRDVADLPDEALAARIEVDCVDILFDLSGHSGAVRLGVFARKPAPVQVCWLGYPNTTGLTNMDYRITDHVVDPPGLSERFHSEQLIRLPISQWCYRPYIVPAAAPDAPKDAGAGPTLGSFNHFQKLSPTVLGAWCRIMKVIPNATLLAAGIPEGQAQLIFRERFAAAGIEPERLRLLARTTTVDKYFELLRDVDVALDSHPYSSAATTLDALWMGVPVVSLAGETSASRSAASILSMLGLSELIASSPGEYAEKCVTLCRTPQRIAELKSALRPLLEKSALMDGPMFARQMETQFRRIWRHWCAVQNGSAGS
ncbi:MAG: tetratricopeptide repeat protein [Betaproteobacteria bacterium]|nr:tetratricopeptide repeat protein [Betaproteobacteria bacterium]